MTLGWRASPTVTTPTAIEADLVAVAGALLELASAALGGSAPTRTYRSAGPPAQDFASKTCDSQLTVYITAAGTGTIGAPTTGRPELSPNGLRTYSFTIDLMRMSAVPTANGAAPSAEALDAIGATHIADYQLMASFVRSLGFDNKRIPSELTSIGVKQVAASTLSTVPPGGGVVALRAVVVMAV